MGPILEFVNMQSFIQKQENEKLGSTMSYLDTFGLQFNENYYQIFDQHPRICENVSSKTNKKNIIWTKNAPFWELLARMLKN